MEDIVSLAWWLMVIGLLIAILVPLVVSHFDRQTQDACLAARAQSEVRAAIYGWRTAPTLSCDTTPLWPFFAVGVGLIMFGLLIIAIRAPRPPQE